MEAHREGKKHSHWSMRGMVNCSRFHSVSQKHVNMPEDSELARIHKKHTKEARGEINRRIANILR